MITELGRRAAKARFNWMCRAVLDTPPLQPRPAQLKIISMVRGPDHLMYLLAIKSFYRHLPGGDIVIMDDGTLTEQHRELFRRHLGAPSFVRIDSVATGPCPRGGCWERLVHILEMSRDSYVLQLDSDMLTTGPIPEVLEAIRDNRSFTLNTEPNQRITSVEETAALARHTLPGPVHIQTLAERSMPDLPAGMGRRYVRGSAGFAGFGRGGANLRTAEDFSSAMQRLTGARWAEWGSEQVASNYVVANSPDGMVLPWPRYACHFPDLPDSAIPDAAMLHFLGSWRWQGGTYLRLARRVIAEMRQPERARPGSFVSRSVVGQGKA